MYGSGLVSASVVQWNGLTLPTTFVNSTQVVAKVAAANRQSSATAPVTVFNPAPGGGLSNTISVLVAPAPAPPAGVGVIQMVSLALDGTAGNGNSNTPPAVSADGRYVAFQSDATNLVAGPASGFADIYVRDTCLGVPSGCTPSTTRVSVANDGTLPNGNSRSPAISANGRYVAFDSSATNLMLNDTNGWSDVFVRDTCIGAPLGCVPTLTPVSVASDGSHGNDSSRDPAISADGRFIAFNSVASNLVANDTNAALDIFLRDTCIGAPAGCTPGTTRISVASDGGQSNGPSIYASISAAGRYISFRTGADNLVPNDKNATVVLHDTCFGAPAGCTPSNRNLYVGYAGDAPDSAIDNLWILSANGRFSGYGSTAKNLVPGDTNQAVDAFVSDNCIGAPAGCIPHNDRVSLTYNGGQGDTGSGAAVSSDDGNHVAFISIASNLLPYAYSASAVYIRTGCTNAPADCVPTTYLVSLNNSSGAPADSFYSDYPAITPDGRYVVFLSNATNLLTGTPSNGRNQIWLARAF
ncbi:MAG: calcium-binding protein [Acidobacteriia bacterium]|nr:calcium-binding protein [Terriglobia bacterium]